MQNRDTFNPLAPRDITLLIFAAVVIVIFVAAATAQTAFVQQAKLLADDGAGTADSLGFSVAISGDTAIVGAPRNGPQGFQSRGAAYIYVKSGSTWTQQQKLIPSDGMTTDQFGYSVAINGNTAAVGRYNTTAGQGRGDGKVYIFTRSGTVWTETQTLVSNDIAAGDLFGNALAFENDTLVIGARQKNNGAAVFFQGAAYVFTRSGPGGMFSQQAKLLASDGGQFDFFGEAVSLSGDTAVIGSVNDFTTPNNIGKAYVFVRNGSTWTEQQILQADGGSPGGAFGTSVAVSGDTAVIGARLENVGGGELGAAYTFVRTGTTWTQGQRFTGLEPTPRNDTFGYAVAIRGNTLAIGSPAHEIVPSIANHGAVYVYSRPSSTDDFSRSDKLIHNDPAPDALGQALAFDGTSIIAGAPAKSSARGAAYIFNGISMNGQGRLIPPEVFINPGFGKAITVSGDTAVIGSNLGVYIYNRSGVNWVFAQKIPATVNGSTTITPGTSISISGDTMLLGAGGSRIDGVFNRGAALVYIRENGTWVFQQQLLASDGDADDSFGTCVALSGDTAIISADGDEVGENAGQGSLYVFTRTGTTWTETQRLMSADGGANDRLGSSLSLSGDTLVTGSPVDGNGAGSATVFNRVGGTWSEGPKFTATDGDSNDQFGRSVAISGDRIAVGSPNHQVGNNGLQGAVYAYSRTAGTWSFAEKVFDQGGSQLDFFGTDVAMSGDAMYVGAVLASSPTVDKSGSVYVFAHSGGAWQKRGEVFAYDGASEDQFGGKVAIDGNYLAVSAMGDDIYGVQNGSGYVIDIRNLNFGGSGSARFDYDGDGKTDHSVFRPSTGAWYLQQSTAGFFGLNFGASDDRVTPADYDGDGKTDIAVYRASTGLWYVLNSSDQSVSYYNFGSAEDLPTPADYDGDGKADISVFRPSTGTWYRTNSSDGSFAAVQFGQTGDVPTIGDFDGDGRSDIAIFRPSTGAWYQTYSSDGTFFGEQFGNSTDKIAPADYDGDGKTDIAIYRPVEGLWYYKNSSSGAYTPYLFGLATDVPVPGDYDGDGKADLAVFRPSDGYWYSVNSSNGSFTIVPWGQNGDLPTPAAFGN